MLFPLRSPRASCRLAEPNPSKSIKLSPARQRLVDDIIALYSCLPAVEHVKRYTPDYVYDDQFVYANDRYKMAGQQFALPKLFKASTNESYEVIRSDDDLIQFKNKQSLDLATRDSEFMQIKYHKDQANEKDCSHEGLGFSFKKWQANNVFKADEDAAQEHVRKYGTGTADGNAPKRDLTS
ncbi:hypothetical protein BU25DRAFT_433179 [Macroventuria anomochaeta]|uniref:Uncharacterized protein n=1 Tax=Macroventuria anomochaeta TaxID=301207 RepID=A0ACB6RVH2_9PLEO|nr:uncharacterized protein BU25DRAFT_433179 [Macroventuria anomochaeta]KAF2624892.1 hypothetical protein BU25DRAFT_433179 [Macroventuria anomochaeta]